jgi:hypothetical protein
MTTNLQFEGAMIFGESGNLYLTTLSRNLPLEALSRTYRFTDNDAFYEKALANMREGQRIYWYEILMRCHLTAATSIVRGRRWINAIAGNAERENYLGLAASLRGLIESAADSSTTLVNVPATLAENHFRIVAAIEGKAAQPFIVNGLEDSLIHYSHGRKLKKGEVAPQSHRAMTVRDYIKILENGQVPDVIECYSELCDVTHPGLTSVGMWLEQLAPLEYQLSLSQEPNMIRTLLNKYEPMFAPLFMFAFNTSLLTLATLNYVPVPEFQTPEVQGSDLTDIKEWRRIAKLFDRKV